jgi:hypothetical protein
MSKNTNKKEARELYWILYGIAVAFGLQVAYDGLALLFGETLRFELGAIAFFVFVLGLAIYERRIRKNAN